MKRIIITENQLKNIQKTLLNELDISSFSNIEEIGCEDMPPYYGLKPGKAFAKNIGNALILFQNDNGRKKPWFYELNLSKDNNSICKRAKELLISYKDEYLNEKLD